MPQTVPLTTDTIILSQIRLFFSRSQFEVLNISIQNQTADKNSMIKFEKVEPDKQHRRSVSSRSTCETDKDFLQTDLDSIKDEQRFIDSEQKMRVLFQVVTPSCFASLVFTLTTCQPAGMCAQASLTDRDELIFTVRRVRSV